MSIGHLYVLLGEVSIQVLCPFFNWIICFPGVESCQFFVYFEDQTFVQGIIGKYVFPYVWFSFHLMLFSLAMQKFFFYFDEIPFVYSFLCVTCSRGHISENIVAWDI